MRLVLESAGYVVVTAANAVEGRAAFERSAPDLLVVDLMMESVDAGLTFVTALREAGATVPVFFLSSAGDYLFELADVSKLGGDGVFQKPLAPDRLLAVIAGRLGQAAPATGASPAAADHRRRSGARRPAGDHRVRGAGSTACRQVLRGTDDRRRRAAPARARAAGATELADPDPLDGGPRAGRRQPVGLPLLEFPVPFPLLTAVGVAVLGYNEILYLFGDRVAETLRSLRRAVHVQIALDWAALTATVVS